VVVTVNIAMATPEDGPHRSARHYHLIAQFQRLDRDVAALCADPRAAQEAGNGQGG